MKRIKILGIVIFSSVQLLLGQDKWSLRDCIDYAQRENIEIRKAALTVESFGVDIKQSKSALFPTLSASISQSFSNSKVENESGKYRFEGTFDGQYGINANWTLYDGKQNLNAIKQANLNKEASEYDKEEIANNIEISITQLYLQVLYAWESIKNNKNILVSSELQLEQSKLFFEEGSIAHSDFAQVEAQYSSDKYNLVLAENSYDNYKLQLKQLLELDTVIDFNIDFPTIQSSEILQPIPSSSDVYSTALAIMPQVRSSQLDINMAEISRSVAKAGYIPTVSLSGSLGTGNRYSDGPSFFTQLNRQFNQRIGLSVSFPIFDNRKTKSAIQKANITIKTAELNYLNTQKELLRTIEELHQEAVSSQSKFYAAQDKVTSVELSYNLIKERYNLGMCNTVELTTEQNNYANALQELLQAKYSAVLSLKLLEFYQGKTITL